MIEINLLGGADKRATISAAAAPERAAKLPQFSGDPTAAGLAGIGLLVLLGLGYAYWSLGARTAELQAQVEQEVADSTRFAATISRLELLKTRQDTVQRKIEVIQQVDQRRYVWPHLLDEISKATPAFAWLTKLTAAEAAPAAAAPAEGEPTPVPAGPGFNLEGNAGSTQALTRFMKNLEASPYIRDVTLVTSAQEIAEGGGLPEIHRRGPLRDAGPCPDPNCPGSPRGVGDATTPPRS